MLSRVRGSLRLPARFQLVAAMNPCPCGRGEGPRAAAAAPRARSRSYAGRLSGPCSTASTCTSRCRRLCYAELPGPPGEEPSAVVAARRGGTGAAGRPAAVEAGSR